MVASALSRESHLRPAGRAARGHRQAEALGIDVHVDRAMPFAMAVDETGILLRPVSDPRLRRRLVTRGILLCLALRRAAA